MNDWVTAQCQHQRNAIVAHTLRLERCSLNENGHDCLKNNNLIQPRYLLGPKGHTHVLLGYNEPDTRNGSEWVHWARPLEWQGVACKLRAPAPVDSRSRYVHSTWQQALRWPLPGEGQSGPLHKSYFHLEGTHTCKHPEGRSMIEMT